MSARTVIATFGGITSLSRDLGHRFPSTVQGWWERDIIPARRQPEVLALARARNLPLTERDLIPALPGEPTTDPVAAEA